MDWKTQLAAVADAFPRAADAFVSMIEKAVVPFMTAFNRRSDSTFSTMRTRISATGRLGVHPRLFLLEPGLHPCIAPLDVNADGYLAEPNVDCAVEITEQMLTVINFEANIKDPQDLQRDDEERARHEDARGTNLASP